MDFLQSENAYHFSSDAVLLANFINYNLPKIFEKKRHIKPPFLMLDLGCGCGIIGLLVLQYIKDNYKNFFEQTYLLGLDNNPIEVENANQNAKKMGLQANYQAFCFDLISEEGLAKSVTQKWAFEKYSMINQNVKHELGVLNNPRLFKLIMANPPWYSKDKGLESKNFSRVNALFAKSETLPAFMNFAQKFLEKHAYLYLVGKAEFLTDYLGQLPKSLSCTTIQNVHNAPDKKAIFFLLESRFQSKASPVLAAPIFLTS